MGDIRHRFARPCTSLMPKLYKNARDVVLTLIALAYLGVCVANAVADKLNSKLVAVAEGPLLLVDPLLSLLHGWYGKTGFRKDLPDVMILLAVVSILLRILTLQDYACTVLRRIIYVAASMYLLRAVHVNLTLLPNPLTSCRVDSKSDLLVVVWHVLDSQYVTCGDVFFSGHAIIFTLLWLIGVTYPGTSTPALWSRHLAGVQAAFSYLTLLLASYHYTIDITMSVLLTTLIWTLFHLAILNREIKESSRFARFLATLDRVHANEDGYEPPLQQCSVRRKSLEEGLCT